MFVFVSLFIVLLGSQIEVEVDFGVRSREIRARDLLNDDYIYFFLFIYS